MFGRIARHFLPKKQNKKTLGLDKKKKKSRQTWKKKQESAKNHSAMCRVQIRNESDHIHTL